MIAPRDDFPSEFERQVGLAFGPGGLLNKSRDFEHRPQQQAMATAVAKACQDRSHLIVEAGTGVGKSLAYLVPSIFHALAENRKALVSTHTINLQEQLFHKDIPVVQKLVPEEFKAVLLKGRQNYLCPLRHFDLAQFFHGHQISHLAHDAIETIDLAGIGDVGVPRLLLPHLLGAAVIKADFIKGLDVPAGLAVKDNNLFVANQGSSTVGEYDATTDCRNAVGTRVERAAHWYCRIEQM